MDETTKNNDLLDKEETEQNKINKETVDNKNEQETTIENKNYAKKQTKIGVWIEKHELFAEIFRFLIIGGIATVIDFVVMGIVEYLFNPSLYPRFIDVFIGGIKPEAIATIVGTGVGFIVGLIFNYIFSIIFVYKTKGNSKSATGFILFAVLSAIGLGIHILGMWVGYDLLHINEWIVKIVLTIVVLIYNYVSRKIFIFNNKKCKNNPQNV